MLARSFASTARVNAFDFASTPPQLRRHLLHLFALAAVTPSGRTPSLGRFTPLSHAGLQAVYRDALDALDRCPRARSRRLK